MASVLDILPTAINKAFKNVFYPAVFTVDVPVVSSDPADPSPPTPTPYTCRAYVEKYSAYYRANSLVTAKDRKVMVLANSLAIEPVKGGRVTMNGGPYSGQTFTVIDYDDGGSNRSIWELQGRL